MALLGEMCGEGRDACDYSKALNHVEPVKSKGYLHKALLASVIQKVALSYAIFT